MKKTKIKYKGKLKSYMQWPVVFLVIMAIMNVVVYTVSIRAGFVVSGFLALFVVLSLLLIFRHRPLILNDLISFATQYGQGTHAVAEKDQRELRIFFVKGLVDEINVLQKGLCAASVHVA